jgi:hypothetical protein
MRCMLLKRVSYIPLIVFIFLAVIRPAIALEENEKLWVGVNVRKPLSADQKWLYSLFTQSRLINKSHPWQSTLFEGGVGYSLFKDKSIWIGYRWSAHNPNNGFYQGNRLWQQLSWIISDKNLIKFFSRTRLEQTMYSDQSQLSFRLRELISVEFKNEVATKFSPLVYDEVFFQLNKTNYTSHQLVSENRLFLGVRLPTSADTFWEIGYINQYQFSTPLNNQNQMNHIASFTYNFI